MYQHQAEDGARLPGTYSPSNSHPPMDEAPASSPSSSPNDQRVNRVNYSNFPYHPPYSHSSDTQYAPQYPSHSQSYFPSMPYDDPNSANTRIPYVRRITPPQPLQQSPTASSVLDPLPVVSPTNPLIPYARRVSPPTSQQFSLTPTTAYPPYEDGHALPVNPIPRIPYARHASPLPAPSPVQQQQFQTVPAAVSYQFGANGQVAHRPFAPPSPREADRNSGNGSVGPKKFCESCHTDSSPEWRRGPTGHKT